MLTSSVSLSSLADASRAAYSETEIRRELCILVLWSARKTARDHLWNERHRCKRMAISSIFRCITHLTCVLPPAPRVCDTQQWRHSQSSAIVTHLLPHLWWGILSVASGSMHHARSAVWSLYLPWRPKNQHTSPDDQKNNNNKQNIKTHTKQRRRM